MPLRVAHSLGGTPADRQGFLFDASSGLWLPRTLVPVADLDAYRFRRYRNGLTIPAGGSVNPIQLSGNYWTGGGVTVNGGGTEFLPGADGMYYLLMWVRVSANPNVSVVHLIFETSIGPFSEALLPAVNTPSQWETSGLFILGAADSLTADISQDGALDITVNCQLWLQFVKP